MQSCMTEKLLALILIGLTFLMPSAQRKELGNEIYLLSALGHAIMQTRHLGPVNVLGIAGQNKAALTAGHAATDTRNITSRTVSVMQNRLASAGLWGLRERSVQVSGQQAQRVLCITRTFA